MIWFLAINFSTTQNSVCLVTRETKLRKLYRKNTSEDLNISSWHPCYERTARDTKTLYKLQSCRSFLDMSFVGLESSRFANPLYRNESVASRHGWRTTSPSHTRITDNLSHSTIHFWKSVPTHLSLYSGRQFIFHNPFPDQYFYCLNIFLFGLLQICIRARKGFWILLRLTTHINNCEFQVIPIDF